VTIRRPGRRLAWVAALACWLAGCQPAAEPAGPDPAAFRAALQEHTERLLWIHYRLDSAMAELAKSEEQSDAGNPSAAGYHAAEAYRLVQAADEALLEQGQVLQQRFNLDRAGTR